MLKTITHAAIAATLLAASTFTVTTTAEARGGRTAAGVIAGTIIGLGVLGAYANARDYDRGRCYEGRRVCRVVGERCFYNRYGEQVCRDKVRCHRPTYCD
ncbi:MAG: hypothetical protein R3D67_01380 [Hyphomicrobiaceae bacterium]